MAAYGARYRLPHQPPEKCAAKALANEPNPPRVTPASEAVPDDELLEAESPPKKLLRRDHEPPDPQRSGADGVALGGETVSRVGD